MAIRSAGTDLEADMVPFIDIVTLLLLFLIVVGDMAAKVNSVAMTLPVADQAKTEKAIGISTEKRIVVQMLREAGKYTAVVESRKYEIIGRGETGSLQKYLEQQVQYRVSRGEAKKNDKTGEVDFPVKLRIPAEAEMDQVERVLLILAKAGLTNVHFAAEPDRSKPVAQR